METTYLVAAKRSPIGSFGKALSSLTAPQFTATVFEACLKSAGVAPETIDQVILGCVLQAGIGQAPARQAMLAANIPPHVAALTVNKVCSSALVAIMLADQSIRLGESQLIVAGGMESMSNAPYLLHKARFGIQLGNTELVDEMIHDGLWDPYSNEHMGQLAEKCAEKFSITREASDTFALESYKRAQSAIEQGFFADEIVPITIKSKRESTVFKDDEEPFKIKPEKVSSLTPVFKRDGTITAANASSLSDGAAVTLLASEKAIAEHKLIPIARIVASATASQDPAWYTTAPVSAVNAVLKKANLSIADIDLFEINEAFACVTITAIKELKLNPETVNIHGGAVALGHPLGCTGARLVTTLVHALKRKKLKRGLVALCNGGGEATAMILEMV
ncbi:MAG: acetyl-CoA C-acyltransferase [Deltaproteobacteria bacterium CG_4_10_14_0_2_um_filter_43_8]|nr:MAG: acetyl-CoA C-acyltransferase [Deltaproteobacteria bacterium CG11_big_fil_rev_8_21_14_0_20_42_23]PJA20834.1 MAG: acetyl-CoA C-acyltransferase [Deltaproteobacteria bacterium CG_4_10_14_0_2_um_filter_43_8]PJC63968.1 MAG: acetyl-CoA C-acyltransferase [Deltaproteobacteria bacterium CG_4_9_14_0_2_um_filter_42_21]